MAEACFDLVLNKRRIDDKDHYSNKRLKLAGDLMEDLFRISLNRLTRDIKYQLERASMRHRDLSIGTAVRADVLTERLLHPLATGNWVGGRTGVSQSARSGGSYECALSPASRDLPALTFAASLRGP